MKNGKSMASGVAAIALLAVLMVPLIGASSCMWSFGGYAEPCGALFMGADEKDWIDAVKTSNASGTYTLPGYDVSRPWPGTPMDGWTITKTAVDLTGFKVNRLKYLDHGGAVAADIKIVAPESLYVPSTNESDHGAPVVNAHPDWVFCAWRWFHPPYGNKSLATNPNNLDLPKDGSCGQWLSDACIKAVEKQASTAYYINSEPKGIYGSRHTCFDIDTPNECLGTKLENEEPLLPTWGVPLQYLNGSTTWQSGYDVDDNTTVKDTQDMWETLTQSYQPILTMFGRYNNDTEAKVEPGFAKLSCIRAHPPKDAQSNNGGSGNNEGGDQSGAGFVTRSLAVELAALAVLACSAF